MDACNGTREKLELLLAKEKEKETKLSLEGESQKLRGGLI